MSKSILVIPIIIAVVIFGAYGFSVHDHNKSFEKTNRGSYESNYCTFGMKSEYGYHSCIEEEEWYQSLIGTEYEGFSHVNLLEYGLYIGKTNTEKLSWNDYDYYYKFEKQSDCENTDTWIPLANQTTFNPDNGRCSQNRVQNIQVDVGEEYVHELFTKSKVIQLNWNGNHEMTLQSGEKYSFPAKIDIQLDDEVTVLRTEYGVNCIPIYFEIQNLGSINNTSGEFTEFVRKGNGTVKFPTYNDYTNYEKEKEICEKSHFRYQIQVYEVNGIRQQ